MITIGVIKGDTRSSDYGSYSCEYFWQLPACLTRAGGGCCLNISGSGQGFFPNEVKGLRLRSCFVVGLHPTGELRQAQTTCWTCCS